MCMLNKIMLNKGKRNWGKKKSHPMPLILFQQMLAILIISNNIIFKSERGFKKTNTFLKTIIIKKNKIRLKK